MIYIDSTPNPSGAYPQAKKQPFPGCVALTDAQAAVFRQYNGFVVVSQGPDGETLVSPNTSAWEAWKATPQPDPSPTMDERISTLEADNQELYEALDMILTGVTE